MALASDSPKAPADGPLGRRDRNRIAALDAMIALFSEGVLYPTPEAVAERAGISARSVYRYYEDREALVRAAIGRHLEVMEPLYYSIAAIGEGDLADRIEQFAEARVRLYEVAAPTARATRVRAATDEVIREQYEATRRALREQIEHQFRPELATFTPRVRRSRLAAVDALCEMESLDHYRVHRGFSSNDTRAMLIDALDALLSTDPKKELHG